MKNSKIGLISLTMALSAVGWANEFMPHTQVLCPESRTVGRVNHDIWLAMSDNIPVRDRIWAVKDLKRICLAFRLKMEKYCVQEIWDTSIFLQEYFHPKTLQKSAHELYSKLIEIYPARVLDTPGLVVN